MKTFSINTLGCKVNQYESQQLRELLEQVGLRQVQTSKDSPELVIINTCCVTHTASAKSRQFMRKARKLNPDAAIVIAGCLPTIQTDELNSRQLDHSAKNVHFIRHRNNLVATLRQLISEKCSEIAKNAEIRPENSDKIEDKLPQLTSFKGQTRAFLKIQNGCDAYCSYCIIPKTRPNVQNKPPQDALKEAQDLVKAGHKEIVLTGIFLGAYGQKTVRRKNWPDNANDKLANLLEKLAQIPNLHRIRLSSLEPADVTERLLNVFSKYPNIMPHLHLSLQSGSGKILKRMCRQYTAEQAVNTIELIKARLDRPAITTDFIVGFPGETDADFQATVKLANWAGFAKMHVFSFSPRAGTTAAKMQNQINTKVIKQRSQVMRDLDIELGYKFRRQFIGWTAAVLIENHNSRTNSGRSERYFMVHLENLQNKPKKNDLVKVKLIENSKDGMIGRIV